MWKSGIFSKTHRTADIAVTVTQNELLIRYSELTYNVRLRVKFRMDLKNIILFCNAGKNACLKKKNMQFSKIGKIHVIL